MRVITTAATVIGCILLLHLSESHRLAFVTNFKLPPVKSSSCCSDAAKRSRGCALALAAAAKSKKKKAGGRPVSGGVKGFGGAAASSPSLKNSVSMDRSKEALRFYDYMEQHAAGDNLKRAALGYFALPDGMQQQQLRGVVALQDLKPGDVLIRIPYELSVNLGQEGDDPTRPAVALLREYCETFRDNLPRKPYFDMLPPFRGDDCLGSTDFFSNEALEALQASTVVEETLHRRARTKARFESDVAADATFPSWIDGTPVTEEHLRWAVWLITSRVLTVQGDAEEGRSYRLLIPFLDMCNHDRESPHILTGRATPGNELKVVAGAHVQQGDPINICYGGGVAGNDRFVQDYGFLDAPAAAYDIVAQQLLGKRRVAEGRSVSMADREKTLEALRSTNIEQDEAMLSEETDGAMRSAIEYRLGLKKALSKLIVME